MRNIHLDRQEFHKSAIPYRETSEYSSAKKSASKERRNQRHASDGDTSRREAAQALIPVTNLDVSPEGIGALFKKARANYVDTTNLLIECGQRLREKRKSLPHGEWLSWLKANRDWLGFGEDTAQRLMKAAAADTASTRYLDADDAIKLNRQIWGNTQKVEPRPAQATATLLPPPTLTSTTTKVDGKSYPHFKSRRQEILAIERAIKRLSQDANQQPTIERYQKCRERCNQLQQDLLEAENNLLEAQALLVRAADMVPA